MNLGSPARRGGGGQRPTTAKFLSIDFSVAGLRGMRVQNPRHPRDSPRSGRGAFNPLGSRSVKTPLVGKRIADEEVHERGAHKSDVAPFLSHRRGPLVYFSVVLFARPRALHFFRAADQRVPSSPCSLLRARDRRDRVLSLMNDPR